MPAIVAGATLLVIFGLNDHARMRILKAFVRQVLQALIGAAVAIAAFVASVQAVSAQDRAKVEAGENLYNDYCFTCHGERLVSSGQTFDLRRLTANDRARFESSVLIGKGQMPPWKGRRSNKRSLSAAADSATED